MKRDRQTAVIQRLLVRAALAAFVLMLLLITFVAKLEHLRSASALDHAQVARNLASGEGLTTSIIHPLGLALGGENAEKVTFSAPLYPVILSLPLRLFEASDRLIALTSLLFGVLTLAAVYLLCLRALSERIAVASVAILALTVSFVMHTISGTEAGLLMLLVTCLFGLLLLWHSSPNQASAWWPAGASLIVALAWLVRYEMIALLPCVAFYWLLVDPQRIWKRMLWTLVPCALVAMPWIVRSSMLLERPIASDFSYMLVSSTNVYPEDAILRLYRGAPDHPWRMALQHPGMMLFKLHPRLVQTYSTLPLLGNPYITSLFLFGVLLATLRHRLAALNWTLLLSIVVTAVTLSLYTEGTGLLIIFVPMMTVLTVKNVADTVAEFTWAAPSSEQGPELRLLKRLRARFRSAQKTGDSGRQVSVALVILILIVSYPMIDYLFVQPAAAPNLTVRGIESLQARGYGVVLSDAPAPVAWYAHTRALLLPSDRYAMAAIEELGIRPDAVYLSPSPRAPRALFPGFERMEDWEYPGVVWVRASDEASVPPEASAR